MRTTPNNKSAPLNRAAPLSRATKVTVAGLGAGAVGLLIQKAAGVDMPVVPPGLIILTVTAVLIVATRWRWTLVLAGLAALAEIPGAVGSGLDADGVGEFAGAAVRGLGAAVALVAGIVAAVAAYRSRKAAPESVA